MVNLKKKFLDIDELIQHLHQLNNGTLVVDYLNCERYEGMALAIMIVFDTEQSEFNLDLQWISLGLDLYGDTLQESYVYQFTNIKPLLDYLESKYQITVTDIPKKFKFDETRFPNPISDHDKKSIYKSAWDEFQSDFKKGLILEPSLNLVYNSLDYL